MPYRLKSLQQYKVMANILCIRCKYSIIRRIEYGEDLYMNLPLCKSICKNNILIPLLDSFDNESIDKNLKPQYEKLEQESILLSYTKKGGNINV